MSAGEVLLSVMPATPALAMELYIRAMDIPLIDTGRHVCLEFEGWSALQFSGRPNLAIGTYGVIVKVIDRVDAPDRPCRLWILITPGPNDRLCPALLKVGSGVHSWTLFWMKRQ